MINSKSIFPVLFKLAIIDNLEIKNERKMVSFFIKEV